MNIPAIKPLRHEADHAAVLAEFEAFLKEHYAAPDGSDEAAYIDAQGAIIADYEKKRWPLPPPSVVEAVMFRMREQGLTQKDLAPLFGTQSRVSEFLRGKRQLTLQTARRLHRQLGIPAEVLLSS